MRMEEHALTKDFSDTTSVNVNKGTMGKTVKVST